MPVGIEVWVTQVPPVTRAWLLLSVLISVAVVRTIRSGLACCILHSSIAMSNRDTTSAVFQL
jgi:hypothetical protein